MNSQRTGERPGQKSPYSRRRRLEAAMRPPEPGRPPRAVSPAPTHRSASAPSSKSRPPREGLSLRKLSFAMFSGIGLLSVFLAPPRPIDEQIHNSASTCTLWGSNASESCSSQAASPAAPRHRGKVIYGDVKAADLERAYQSIKSEYEALALHPAVSTHWRVLASHTDGSEVSLLQHPTDPSCPYVRMTSIMPGTIQEVWDFLELKNWEESMPRMDPFYEGLTVFEDFRHRGVEMKLARKTTKRIVTFGKRDFTFVSVSDRPRGDGAWVSGTVSVATDRIPREGGYVRAYQDSVAFYEAADDDSTTGDPRMRLTIVFRLDLNDSREGGGGGYVPMWMYVRTVGATGMASVQNMKRRLVELAGERDEGRGGAAPCDGSWLTRIRNGTGRC